MKSLVLRFFAVVFIFGSFPVYSSLQGKRAVRLMKDLSVGNVEAYRSRKRGIGDDDMKKVFQFVNNNGDSFLHFLVRLERFESLQQVYSPNVERVFIEEVMDIYETLPKWKFMKLLTSKNKEGFSPLEEAVISQAALESPRDWKTVTIPSQNRGLAYKALQMAVGSYSWPSRAAFDAMILALPPVGVGIIAYNAGNDILAEIGVAAAVTACGFVFKRLSDSKRVRRELSLR